MVSQETREKLIEIYDDISKLGKLGANSVHRRALSIVGAQIPDHDNVFTRCDPGGPPGHGGRTRLAFNLAYSEVAQDDRRRTVFVDPTEHLASQFIDFWTGRLDVLEVRTQDDSLIEQAEALAREYIREHYPIVSINHTAGRSAAEVIDALRAVAAVLEKQSNDGSATISSEAIQQLPFVHPISILYREKCDLIGTQVGSHRWRVNGTILDQQIRNVFSCSDADSCCGNKTHSKYGEWEWREVWRDTGDTSNPPPITPPDFERYPWGNRCPVFSPGIGGTVSSDWGWRNINGNLQFHQGMDILAPIGTAIHSVGTGYIVHINRNGAAGETGVIIRSGDQVIQYWHIVPDPNIRVGQGTYGGLVLGAISAQHPHPHFHFARYNPPDGDWTKKLPSNSVDPCP